MNAQFLPQPAAARWLLAIICIFTMTTAVYSLVLPLGEAADEFEHFALIRFIAENHRPPLTLAEQQTISIKGDASPFYHGLVALLTQHVDVSSLPDLPDPRHQIKRAIPADRLPIKGLYHTEDEYFPFRGIVLAWHLARLVSIPLGIATIVAIFLTTRLIIPQRPFLAVAAAGFVAFIPRYIITSAIVSDDNLVIPLIAFALYFLVRVVRGDARRRSLIGLGIFMGLAALSKYHSLLLVPVVTVGLGFTAWQQNWGWVVGLRRWAIPMLAFVLVAGWWFLFVAANFNRIEQLGLVEGLVAPLGDPVIAASIDELANGSQDESLGYETELGGLAWGWLLYRTFWFRLGRGHVIDDPTANGLLALLALAGLVGLGAWGFRQRAKIGPALGQPRRWRVDILLLAFYLALIFGLVLTRYLTLPTRETAQGRHLFPALTAVALFLVLGLSQLPPLFKRGASAGRWTAASLTGSLIAFSLVTLPAFVVPVYYPYLPIQRTGPSSQPPVAGFFAGTLKLRRVVLPSSPTNAGDAVPVTLFWQTQTDLRRDHLLKLCLYDTGGVPAACKLTHPADGRWPTRAWEPGYTLRDEIHIPTPACLLPGSYQLRLTVLPLRTDTAVTQTTTPAETISLGSVTLVAGPAVQSAGDAFWLGSQRYQAGEIDLSQIRQALTVIQLQPAGDEATFSLAGGQGDAVWPPVNPPLVYPCSATTAATVFSFIADPGVAPGHYQLRRTRETEPLPQIIVRTRPRNFSLPPAAQTPPVATFGANLALPAYALDSSPRLPGQTIDITLTWQALETMLHRYVASIHLLDSDVAMWGQIDHILGDDFEYPNNLWAPGEVVSQTLRLPIDADAPPGLYALEFSVYDKTSGNFDFLPVTAAANPEPAKHLNLGQIRVLDPTYGRPPTHVLAVTLGEQIDLLGYDLSNTQAAPGDTLQLTLHWQARRQPLADYTVFSQLVGPDGQVWGQQDNQPQAGDFPTSTWPAKEQVIDRYNLSLPAVAPPGRYRLLVGMYNLATGQRLPAVTAAGRPLPDNAIELATILVK